MPGHSEETGLAWVTEMPREQPPHCGARKLRGPSPGRNPHGRPWWLHSRKRDQKCCSLPSGLPTTCTLHRPALQCLVHSSRVGSEQTREPLPDKFPKPGGMPKEPPIQASRLILVAKDRECPTCSFVKDNLHPMKKYISAKAFHSPGSGQSSGQRLPLCVGREWCGRGQPA